MYFQSGTATEFLYLARSSADGGYRDRLFDFIILFFICCDDKVNRWKPSSLYTPQFREGLGSALIHLIGCQVAQELTGLDASRPWHSRLCMHCPRRVAYLDWFKIVCHAVWPRFVVESWRKRCSHSFRIHIAPPLNLSKRSSWCSGSHTVGRSFPQPQLEPLTNSLLVFEIQDGVYVFTGLTSEFKVKAVTTPTLPGLCHCIPRFAALRSNEIWGAIKFNDVIRGNHVAPLLSSLNLCCHTFLPT
jgi:hypothetical protein